MAYKEISDDLWVKIEPLLEQFKRKKSGGSKPLDFRVILNAIFYVLTCYGAKSTVHEHFQRWVAAGIFSKIFQLALEEYDELEGIAWEWQMMDGLLVQAPVRGQALCLSEESLGRNPTDRGRSGSKVHLHVDQQGIPIGIIVVGANVHDSCLISPTIESDSISRPEASLAGADP